MALWACLDCRFAKLLAWILGSLVRGSLTMRVAPIFVASALLFSLSCKDASESRSGAASASSPSSGSSKERKKKRRKAEVAETLPAVEMAPLGDQPGYLPGGLLYTSVVVGEAQRYWDSLPQPPDLERDGIRAAREIGFNPFSANWAEQFHVEDDAVISATILRPLDEGAAGLRAKIEAARGGGTTSVTLSDESKRLAAGLAFHSRVHVPSKDSARTLAAMVGPFGSRHRERGALACADIKGVTCVAPGSSDVFIFREHKDAVVIDIIVYSHGSYDLESWGLITDTEGSYALASRRQAIRTAFAAEPAKVPHVEELAGDAAMWIEAKALGRLAVLSGVERMVDVVASRGGDPTYAVERLQRTESVLKASLLFPGVAMSFDYVDDDLHGVASWPVAGALWGRMAVRSVVTRASSVPVPTLEALCQNSVACFRAQGIPDTRPLAKRLLSEGFGKDFEDVVRALERDEEFTMTLLLAGAWPNLLAAAQNAPESFRGAEAGVARTIRDAVLRAEGFGGVLQRYAVKGFLSFDGDYALYARAAKSDIDAAKGLIGLAGQTTKDIELPQGGGRAVTLKLDDNPPSHAFFKTGDEDFGWVGLASDAREFAAVLGAKSETPQGPMAYLEFPSLWKLVQPMGDDDLNFFREWARGRRLRFVLELDSGAPRLRAMLGRSK